MIQFKASHYRRVQPCHWAKGQRSGTWPQGLTQWSLGLGCCCLLLLCLRSSCPSFPFGLPKRVRQTACKKIRSQNNHKPIMQFNTKSISPIQHKIIEVWAHTKTTESLATVARMSAQEMVWGQTNSSSDLIASITSKPLREFKLGPAVFSPTKFSLSSSRIEASHPCKTLNVQYYVLI